MAIKESLLKNLPSRPGVYLFRGAAGKVLYVGKAKVLRTRVRSYFRALAQLDELKQKMVAEVRAVDTIVCDSEYEALMLEATLIRQHRPPYNIVMMDDKRYLYIKVTREKWPRVYTVRKVVRDGAKYFGPYSSARSVRQTLRLLQRLFPHRTDRDSDSKWTLPHPLFSKISRVESQSVNRLIESGRYAQEDYDKNIEQVINFLKGDREKVRRVLEDGMKEAADRQQYERAAIWRDQLGALEKLLDRQKIYWPRRESFDCLSVATDKTRTAVNVFSVRNGALTSKNSWLMKHRGRVDVDEVVRQFLLQYYQAVTERPPLILVPVQLEDVVLLRQWLSVKKLIVPQRGRKRQLMALGKLNAKHLLMTERAQDQVTGRWYKASGALARALELKSKKLQRIETYDIASTQGTLATGAMVVFSDGEPERGQYRKFRVKLDDKPDDFAALAQVIARRFSGRHPNWKRPDLILIDGGKGQLSAVRRVLVELGLKIPVASVAKREEELYVPGRQAPILLPYDDDAILLVQRMRDEAHRVTNSYHRLLRGKKQQKSIFDEIPGVGPVLKKRLLNEFGSLKGVRAASQEDLAVVVGKEKAKIVRDYL